jgi:hypothetical protein
MTHAFLTSAIFGGEWSASRSGRFTSKKGATLFIEYELVWVPKPIWTPWMTENLLPHRDSKSELSVLQLVSSLCTDAARVVSADSRHGNITKSTPSTRDGAYQP